jgi:MFS family permease
MLSFDLLAQMFHRAWVGSFERKSFFLMVCLMALTGLIFIFCSGLALDRGIWLSLSLYFIPFFISGGCFMAVGVALIRHYYRKMKSGASSLPEILHQSWEMMLSASYLSFPMLLGFLVLWMILGFFLLLEEIPLFGTFFGVILSFGSVILFLGAFLLAVLLLLTLFFVLPGISLRRSFELKNTLLALVKRVGRDPFSHLILFLVSILPISLFVPLLILAIHFTEFTFVAEGTVFEALLQRFFMMLPCVCLLTPFVIFFFYFASETYYWSLSQRKDSLQPK